MQLDLELKSETAAPRFIAYYRISPGGRRKDKRALQDDVDNDEDNTLGLEAQRQAVRRFLNGQELVGEFTEIESGKKHTNRPRLLQAIAECKRLNAKLLIAKLDRLARNVHFISGLMESNIEFTALDLPAANNFTIHIFAAVAENERETTSKRVKAALAVKRQLGQAGEVIGHDAEGVPLYKLGNPKLDAARELSRSAPRNPPPGASTATRMLIQEWRKTKSLKWIADTLNENGVRAPRGGKWHPSSVRIQR